jgi:FkbM family methyltransferase
LGLDVGANIGYTTLHLCRAMDKVIAVEPDPRSRKLLIKNIEINGFTDKVTFYDFAISDTNGKQNIYLAEKNNNLTTLCRSASKFSLEKYRKSKITTTSIDNLGILPNFIKMDIEGYEVEVLEGAMKALNSVKQCKILIEVHPQYYSKERNFADVLKKLIKIGFRFKYVVSAGVPRPDLFKKHGYKPLRGAPKNKRAIYDCVSTEHAIEWSSRQIKQKIRKGKISQKIIRAILLTKG